MGTIFLVRLLMTVKKPPITTENTQINICTAAAKSTICSLPHSFSFFLPLFLYLSLFFVVVACSLYDYPRAAFTDHFAEFIRLIERQIHYLLKVGGVVGGSGYGGGGGGGRGFGKV